MELGEDLELLVKVFVRVGVVWLGRHCFSVLERERGQLRRGDRGTL
jgi:hypothetical protein